MSDAAPPTLAMLLAERRWVVGLARHLVRDEDAADDLAQDAWLQASQRPPKTASSPRGWLATVLYRLAARRRRDSVRRERRERAVARPDVAPATLDVVEAAETHRFVVEAVLALDEPFRTAVLLRYFDGCEPEEVARRTGTSAATARSRVRRGVETLRARLAGDDRARARLLALVTALPTAAGPASESAPPMHGAEDARSIAGAESAGGYPVIAGGRGHRVAWTIVAAGLGALLVSLAMWVAGRDRPEEATSAAGVAASADDPHDADRPAPALAAGGDRGHGAAADPSRSEAARARLVGTARRADGVAVAGAVVEVWSTSASEAPSPRLAAAVAGADGRFRLEGLERGEVTLVARAPGLATQRVGTVRRDGANVCAATLEPGGTVERDVILEAAGTWELEVVEAGGAPAGGVRVTAEVATADGWQGWLPVDEAVTAADGRLTLRSVPHDATVRVVASPAGRWPTVAGPWESPDELPARGRVELRSVGLRTVGITVRDGATGAAVGGASVFLGTVGADPSLGDPFRRSATCDATGRAVFAAVPAVALHASASLQPPGTDVRTPPRTGNVAVPSDAVAADVLLSTAPSPLEASSRARLRLERVRVVGPDGSPVADAMVLTSRGVGGAIEGLGRVRGGEGDVGASWPPARTAEAFAPMDARGAPLPFGAAVAAFDASGLATVVLPPERLLRGRVFDADGGPAAGARVRAIPARWRAEGLSLAGHTEHSAARTGPRGEFELRQLADEPYDVVVVAPVDRVAPAPARATPGGAPLELRLVVASAARLQVIAGADAPVAGARVQVWRGGDAPSDPAFATATTDARGVARIRGLDLGASHRLEVRPPAGLDGAVAVERRGWIPAATSVVDLAAVVHVTVVDVVGRPAPSARVVEVRRDGTHVECCVADASGRATWDDPTPDGGRLLALAPGVEPDDAVLRAARAARDARPGEEVVLVVFPGVPFEVEVRGAPADDVDVDVFAREPRGGFHADRFAATADGRFAGHVDEVGARRWVVVRDRARTRVGYAADVRAGEGPVRIDLRPALGLSGRVTAPTPVGRVIVGVQQVDGPVRDVVETDERGAWSVGGLPPGRYVVTARPVDGDGSLDDRREADAGSTVDLALH